MDQRNTRLVRLFSLLLLTAQNIFHFIALIPTPSILFLETVERHRCIYVLLNVFTQLLFSVTTLVPSLYTSLTLRDRLFPNYHGHHFAGRDVFSMICEQRYLFWLNTGETPETFLVIVHRITPNLLRITRQGNPIQRLRRYKLNVVNRVLLIFIWLRKYPHIDTLALLFDVSPQTVSALIYQETSVLWHYFQHLVDWPSIRQWNAMRGIWREFPNAVGCIDVTPHEIYIPSVEPQRDFYSGHRHFHLLSTQLICDNQGHIRFLQAGFLGSMHDTQSFRLMDRIGPGLTLDIPANAVFLADKGYPDVPPLLTPFRQNQIRRMPNNREKRKARRFNRKLSTKRVSVEHIFKHLKEYKCVTGIWRQPRWFFPVVIELCTFLTERRISLFEDL